VTPDPIIERVPLVCTLAEVCAILRISRAHAWRMRRDRTFPVRELEPNFDSSHPRFAGEDVIAVVRQRSTLGARRWSRVGMTEANRCCALGSDGPCRSGRFGSR
jgi:hypothetical protein